MKYVLSGLRNVALTGLPGGARSFRIRTWPRVAAIPGRETPALRAHRNRSTLHREMVMLGLASALFVASLVSAVFAFAGIATGNTDDTGIAKAALLVCLGSLVVILFALAVSARRSPA